MTSQLDHYILVIDDDRDLREMVCEMLESRGYLAANVEDGLGALAFLRAHPACLVLLDWHIAPMDAPAIKATIDADPALHAIPVVVVTADLRIDPAQLTGYAGHLAKPIDLGALFDVVARHCGCD